MHLICIQCTVLDHCTSFIHANRLQDRWGITCDCGCQQGHGYMNILLTLACFCLFFTLIIFHPHAAGCNGHTLFKHWKVWKSDSFWKVNNLSHTSSLHVPHSKGTTSIPHSKAIYLHLTLQCLTLQCLTLLLSTFLYCISFSHESLQNTDFKIHKNNKSQIGKSLLTLLKQHYLVR